jgi:nucleotide-binding universal stress UspA family protein
MSFDRGLKTIVVATDLEGQAEAALEYARKLALNYGSRIVLAHGLDPMEYAAVDGLPGSVASHLTIEARKVLDKLAGDLLREGIHSHSEVRQGTVAEMLVDVARQYEAGLIVIGTKGMEGAGPVVVGAIAEQLVRLAPCPVLAVAADWNAGPNRPTPGGPVLLTIERNDAAAAAAATAYSLAETFDRPLLVLHVRTAAEAAAGINPCAASLEDFGIKLPPRPHHALRGGSGWLVNEAPVHCLVKDGNPADAVAEAIAENHPCILVAGVKRTSGTPGPHGTAFALLSSSRVPVLCVPPEMASAGVEREVAVPAGTW